ncbi:MAG: LacI family DNA-binding transcriptional regulator [Armatimonadota bacterium]|nr:LacI family DNA-binding transcriptional regulator [Armatimonadota bacterium]
MQTGPTIRDVALHAGVSVATVSRVINDSPHKVHPVTRRRVLRAVAHLGYYPNAVAQGLRRGTTRTIALIVPDISNPFFPAVARGVEDVARRHGYALVLGNTDGDAARERAYLEILRKRWVDGVLFASASGDARPLRMLRAGGVPAVLIAREATDGEIDTVLVDSFAGMRLATAHLLRLGHRRIAYIGGPRGLPVARERLRGYRQALRDQGICPDPRLVVAGDFRVEGGRTAVRRLLARRSTFTALAAANDLMAIGAMEALRAAGRRIPDDVAVVGFDDIPFAAFVDPPLTTVAQPTYRLGALAMERLLALMRGEAGAPRRMVLKPQLVVRRSCGGPPSPRRVGGTAARLRPVPMRPAKHSVPREEMG